MARYNLLVASALVILGLSLGVQGQFPYCRCIDYDEVSSPYVVVLDDTSSSSGTYTATFKVVDAPKPANPTYCYNKILNDGVSKIEFDSSAICLEDANKPIVRINGVVSQPSGMTIPPNFPGKAAVKVKFIPDYMGQDVTITITGRGACANWKTLFNAPAEGVFSFAVYSDDNKCCPTAKIFPPPPPPPPVSTPIQPTQSPLQPTQVPPPPPVSTPFPFCRCERGTANTPYSLDSADVKMTSDATYNWYTMPFSVRPASGGPCSNMDFEKLEISIRDACKSSVGKTAYITTGSSGAVSARTVLFSNFGPNRSLIKVTRLPWDKDTAEGSTVAIGFLKSSRCPTLRQALPAEARISFFNAKDTCCPTYSFPR